MLRLLKIKDVRRKLMWMAGILLLARMAIAVPVPGLDTSLVKAWLSANGSNMASLFSSFTGGAFENFSMFALGITPMITAQIVIQLLSGIVPVLGRLKKKGEHGHKQLQAITRACAIILAFVQGCAVGAWFSQNGLLGSGLAGVIAIAAGMTAGSAIMIWLAWILTERSFGNGESVILAANIASGMPDSLSSLFQELTEGKGMAAAIFSVTAAIAVIAAVCVAIIYMTNGYFPLDVQYSTKMAGFNAEMGDIPVKVSATGVMPAICAAAVISVPQMLATVTGKGYGSGLSKVILNMLNQDNWFHSSSWVNSLGLLVYAGLIVAFSFYYLPVSFNGADVADGIRRAGGFLPGIPAGDETEEYVTGTARRLAVTGTWMLLLVILVPMAICGELGVSSSISGTGLVIVAGVISETGEQIRMEAEGQSCSRLL